MRAVPRKQELEERRKEEELKRMEALRVAEEPFSRLLSHSKSKPFDVL